MAKHSLTPDDDDVTNGASAASADVVADDFPSQLDVEEFWLDQIVVVAAVGAVDMFTAPRLTEAIGVAAAKSPAALDRCRSVTHHSGRKAMIEKNAADRMTTAPVSRANGPH